MGLTRTGAPAAERLRALLADKFPAPADQPDTALLLLDPRTGHEEVRLYSPAAGAAPGHATGVYRSHHPHDAFALDLIETLHAHRLHHWNPRLDGFAAATTEPRTGRLASPIGWAIDLRHLQEDA
ncbi:hypothetical protein ABT224_20095 [Streptomyces sp. NPDC001584]|uniref:hypothetical protein n=1 Tax=Streptomyces sp. NPDC001584 TaxID=3154521 RepID=UPI003316C491